MFEELVWWALQALPDEILVGMDLIFQRSKLSSKALNIQKACFRARVTLSVKPILLIEVIPIPFTTYPKIGLMICSQLHVVPERVVSRTGYIHIRTPLQFPVMRMRMPLRKLQVSI